MSPERFCYIYISRMYWILILLLLSINVIVLLFYTCIINIDVY